MHIQGSANSKRTLPSQWDEKRTYIFDFGKYSGTSLFAVPKTYLYWIINLKVYEGKPKLKDALISLGYLRDSDLSEPNINISHSINKSTQEDRNNSAIFAAPHLIACHSTETGNMCRDALSPMLRAIATGDSLALHGFGAPRCTPAPAPQRQSPAKARTRTGRDSGSPCSGSPQTAAPGTLRRPRPALGGGNDVPHGAGRLKSSERPPALWPAVQAASEAGKGPPDGKPPAASGGPTR